MQVTSSSLRREVRHAAPFLALALLVWVAGVGAARWRGAAPGAALAGWQKSYLELPEAQQRLYRAIREGIYDAENVRAETKVWPEAARLADEGVPPFAPDGLSPSLTWRTARQGPYVNYLGEGDGQRWLILFIEPDPKALKTPGEAAPPVDEEHHTLPDGTALHVTVWTQSSTEPPPRGVLAFPVAEGWTQVLSPRPP
ncbi:MAG: hypothetical protein IT380_29175 [Myxococcales bacterium]|nr:hypothetical protein [Myxococcales bacterium]